MASQLFHSPIGTLEISARAGRLLSIGFQGKDPIFAETAFNGQSEDPVLDLACKQLDEYFAGTRRKFDVPIAMQGTPFQLRVWSLLMRIPFGMTVSYRDLSKAVGSEASSRMVARANATNPLPIIVPCHRVVASDGSTAGFAGGVRVKQALLEQEMAGAGVFAAAMG